MKALHSFFFLVQFFIFLCITALYAEDPPEDPGDEAPYIISKACPLLQHEYHFDADLTSLLSLSDRSRGWGYSTKDRDAYNRPQEAVRAQNCYQKLDADFIREPESVIYLTFDEGYEYGITASILDTLKEKEVHAVFFVTLPYVKQEPELIRRIIDEGHVIGSHSVSHPVDGMPSLPLNRQLLEIKELHDYMLTNFQYEMTLFRFPAGIYSERSLALIQRIGYRSVFWSFAYRDWLTDAQPSKEEAIYRMTSQLHPGAIYLLHAVSTTNDAVLGDFIDEARKQGYRFGYYSNFNIS